MALASWYLPFMSTPAMPKTLHLLLRAGADPRALEAHLDGLDAPGRTAEALGLSARDLSALFERCAGAGSFGLADLVPPATPADATVIYAGRNSLPLFRSFQKRFRRLPGDVVAGFNFQRMSFVTGPGYFTVTEAERGELLFDYTRVPAGEHPPGWPPVRGNERGLSRLVYKDLHDYCRRVSGDVIIGRATRLGKPMDQYFILVRK